MSEKLNYCTLHNHTENSLKNSPVNVKELVSTAKGMGVKAIALTDTSAMTGIIEFIEECKKQNITGIPGIEAVMNENLNTLVLIARNYEGYKEINRAFKEANNNIFTDNDSNIKYPLFSMDILEKYLNKDNVIILSSGINSIFAGILLKNHKIDAQIKELKESQKELPNPYDPAFIKNNAILDEIEENLAKLIEKRDKVQKFSKKEFSKKMAALEGLKNTEPELYKKKKIILDKEILEIKNLTYEIPEILKRIDELKARKKSLKLKINSSKKKHKKYNDIQKKIDEIEKDRQKDSLLLSECNDILKRLIHHFGKSFYIELSNHEDPNEKLVLDSLIRLNTENNYDIDYIIAHETRFIKKSDVEEYQLIKSMEKNNWITLAPSDNEYYLKTDKEILDTLYSCFEHNLIDQAYNNTVNIINSICETLIFPDTHKDSNKHYPKYIPIKEDEKGLSADIIMGKHIEDGLIKRGFDRKTLPKEYAERIVTEYNVIKDMGFCDYLLIVEDYIKYGKQLDKNGVGPGRGSAAGSVICYFLGITNIDPLKYGLKFERFLNKARVSMPDIDTDFSSEIRYKVTDYVKSRYGEDTVAFIRTKQTQKGRATLRNVARIFGVRDKNDKMAYYNLGDSMAKHLPTMGNFKLEEYKDSILSDNNSKIAKEILDKSLKIEGNMTTVGTHAAGVIIGDGTPLTDIVPVFYNTEMEEWTVSCDMVEAENIGLLKMDFLGLNNLDIISETVKRVKKYENIDLDMDNIPFEPEVFEHIYAEGKTKSVFQFESKGMRDMLIKFKPDCFDDIILLNAAYRPGPMDFLDNIIKTKKGELKPHYCVKELEDILAPTYGYPIYQEQLMDIFAICAGFSQGEADIIRRYMSKKKVEAFKSYKDQFINGLIEHGAKQKEAEDLWDSLVSFSAYAFNKSHSCAYATVSYQTAYLKYHYPEYYMCAVLNNSSVNKLTDILYECKELGIKIMLPDINRGFENFENSRQGIVFGLTRIKGIKNKILPFIKERRENGPYSSYKDFIIRTRCSDKIINDLVNAGCFDSFREKMRNSYILAYSDIIPMLEKKDKILQMIQKLETKMATEEKIKKSENKEYELLKEELASIDKEINLYSPSVDIEDTEENLMIERELLGGYVSGHPLDPYDMYFRSGKITLLSDIEVGEGTFAGMIKNVYHTKRKADGKDMAFFTLEDVSGVADINCFAKEYEIYKEFIYEGNVVEIQGKIFDDEILKIKVNSISHLRPFKKPIFLSVIDEKQEQQMIKNIQYYADDDGHPVLLHRQDTGELRYLSDIYIKDTIVKDYLNKNGARVDKDGYYIKALFPTK